MTNSRPLILKTDFIIVRYLRKRPAILVSIFMENITGVGWSNSRHYFHKLLRHIKRFLNDNGVRSSISVDDSLIVADNKHVADHTDFAITTFTDLVFIISYNKSSLVPSSRIEYVHGFNFVIADELRARNTNSINKTVK